MSLVIVSGPEPARKNFVQSKPNFIISTSSVVIFSIRCSDTSNLDIDEPVKGPATGDVDQSSKEKAVTNFHIKHFVKDAVI